MGKELKFSIDKKTQLGRGATATIYKAIDNDGEECAAKIYNEETTVNKEKINAMLSNVPANVTIDFAGKTYPQLAWPTSLLESNGTPTGYLMPLVDLNDSFPLDYYYDQVLFNKLKAPDEAAISYKLEIAKNLSLIVAELHSHGHYFIDLKPQNIRVFRRTHIVTLLDCDGFSIKSNNNKRYPAELISTDYISPEAYRENIPPQELEENQDRYALAVIIFQLLNQGTHPFQGILKDSTGAATNDEKAASGLYPHGLVVDSRIAPRPQSTHSLWLESTRKLFDQAFIGSRSTRPSAAEWAEHFNQLLEDKSLVRCDRFPTNVAHMRFKRRKCPACYLSELPKFNEASTKLTVSDKYAEIARGNSSANQSNSTPSNTDYGYLPWIIGVIVLLVMMSVFNKSPAPDETSAYEAAPAVESTLVPLTEYAIPQELSSPSEQPALPPEVANPAPNGYAALYLADEGFGFWWAVGWPSEKEAKAAAKKGCRKFYGSCKQHISGASRCVATADGAISRGWALADSKTEAENLAIIQCQEEGDVCTIPPEGSGCAG
jgi:serine/threonine protein kinase